MSRSDAFGIAPSKCGPGRDRTAKVVEAAHASAGEAPLVVEEFSHRGNDDSDLSRRLLRDGYLH